MPGLTTKEILARLGLGSAARRIADFQHEVARLRKHAESYRRRAEKRDHDLDAENERLRETAERMLASMCGKHGYSFWETELRTALVPAKSPQPDEPEVERLKADNERLREAAEPFYAGHQLSQAVAGDWCQACHEDWPCKGEMLRRTALATEKGE
jgi:hypothetical protein